MFLHAVLVDQFVNLRDDGLRTPESIAVDALFPTGNLFAALERRLDAAKTAVIGTAKGRVERRIGLPFEIAEAVPVVGAILFHRQQSHASSGIS